MKKIVTVKLIGKLILLGVILSLVISPDADAQSYKQCKIDNSNYKCALNIAYGEHQLQKYDLYLPKNIKSGALVPLVIYVHGGGYFTGDKKTGVNSKIPAKKYLDAGMAWATINYRLSGEFPFRKSSAMPHPVQMADGARALQKLKATAKYHGIDKEKIALAGSSAGGGISMWVSLHDDLAKPESGDFELRQSTKVPCLGLVDTQTTLNIQEVADLMEGTPYALDDGLAGLYGLTKEQYARNPSRWNRVLRESYKVASPISHLDADDDLSVVIVHALGYDTGDIHGAEFGTYLTEGEPRSLANDYNRNSLDQFNIPFELHTSVSDKEDAKNLIFKGLKRCLDKI